MSNFYDYLQNNNTEQQDMTRDLPVARRKPVQQNNVNMYSSAMNSIEQIKQQLYDKIDVCCAQYGLYGLKVIDRAIADSLRSMINGVNPSQSSNTARPYVQPRETEPISVQGHMYNMNRPIMSQSNMTFDEALTDSFMNNFDAIMTECDRDADARAQEQIKQRLYEQQQADLIVAQNVETAKKEAEIDLSKHENDFVESTGEETHV